jgi:hypothetical protein
MREKKKKEVIGTYKYDRSVEMKLIKFEGGKLCM